MVTELVSCREGDRFLRNIFVFGPDFERDIDGFDSFGK